jgi:glycosyltransferase involved in cell wall biosynthesis
VTPIESPIESIGVEIVVKGYPRLSETFIAQEIRALEAAGLPIRIVSLRRPTDAGVHPIHREIGADILYLPEYLLAEPGRVWRAWRKIAKLPGYRAARAAWLSDLRRDPTPNRVRRWGQAMVLAAEHDPAFGRLHAHFLHTPGSVARYAALILGIGWSASAHAVDIYTTPDWELSEKLAAADWVTTCTEANRAHLAACAPDPGKIDLVYHGIDLQRFPPQPRAPHAGPVRILCVSRLVEKKGVDDVLKALAKLPAGLAWTFTHIGGGELANEMKKLTQAIGIESKMSWLKAMSQDELLVQYRNADVFVLASRIAADGDRDGLPNVLMEAQSQGLACLATRVSAIPELIQGGVTGLLVEPGDLDGLANGLERLIGDADLRHRLGEAGQARVRREFDFCQCFESLPQKFGLVRLTAAKVA